MTPACKRLLFWPFRREPVQAQRRLGWDYAEWGHVSDEDVAAMTSLRDAPHVDQAFPQRVLVLTVLSPPLPLPNAGLSTPPTLIGPFLTVLSSSRSRPPLCPQSPNPTLRCSEKAGARMARLHRT